MAGGAQDEAAHQHGLGAYSHVVAPRLSSPISGLSQRVVEAAGLVVCWRLVVGRVGGAVPWPVRLVGRGRGSLPAWTLTFHGGKMGTGATFLWQKSSIRAGWVLTVDHGDAMTVVLVGGVGARPST